MTPNEYQILSCLAFRYGITLDSIMEANIMKLQERYPKGFTMKDSLNRE